MPNFAPPQVYAYISLVFVILAIFSFCAGTHILFQVNNNKTPNNSSTVDPVLIPGNLSNSSSPSTGVSGTPSPSPETTTEKSPQLAKVHPALVYIDYVCLVFFTIEYLLKLIIARNRCKYVTGFNTIIDFLAILPDYIEFIIEALDTESLGEGGRVIAQTMPFFRLLRAFRIFRLIRRVPGLWIMMYTLKASFKELSLMLVVLLVGTLLFSSLIFFVDDTAVFKSIPHGFWWAIVTMTTGGREYVFMIMYNL